MNPLRHKIRNSRIIMLSISSSSNEIILQHKPTIKQLATIRRFFATIIEVTGLPVASF